MASNFSASVGERFWRRSRSWGESWPFIEAIADGSSVGYAEAAPTLLTMASPMIALVAMVCRRKFIVRNV